MLLLRRRLTLLQSCRPLDQSEPGAVATGPRLNLGSLTTIFPTESLAGLF